MSRARRLACLLASLATSAGAVVILAASPQWAGASGPAVAILTLAASSPTATAGSSLTLTATVTGAAPTGEVTFLDHGSPLACGGSSTVPLSNATTETATCTISSVAGLPGPHSFTALYLGDGANLPASASLEESVVPGATATALSAPDVGQGTPVTLAATVTAPAGATPTGSVVFSDDGVVMSACGGSSGVALSAGIAQCTLASGYPAPGSHLVEAAYSGSEADGPSVASAVEVVGAPPAGVAATSTVLDVSSRDPSADSPVALGAVVTSSTTPTRPPSGTVTFTADGVALSACHGLSASPVAGTDQAGATCTLPGGFPAPTPVDLQAVFTPAPGSALAPSLARAVAVDPVPGTGAVTVTASPDPAPGGSPVTVTAAVATDATGAPATGSVQFDVGGTAAGCNQASSGTLSLASGSATCTLKAPSPGTILVTAAYLGSATLQPATAVAPLTVDAPVAATSVQLTSTDNPVATGTGVTYTAAVSGGATTPTGSVSFTANGAPVAGCARISLSAGPSTGTATCDVASGYSTAGTVVVTATYSGDGTHLPGAQALSEVVGTASGAPPAIVLSGPPPPVTIDTPVTYTAALTGSSRAPAGSISFLDGGTPIPGCASVALVEVGSGDTSEAACPVASGYSTDLGHEVAAVFQGSTSMGPASAALYVTPIASNAGMSLTVNPTPQVQGQSGSVSASFDGTAGSPTGTVSFIGIDIPSSNCPPQTVSLFTQGCPITGASAGTLFSIQSIYSGDEAYAPAIAAIADEATRTGATPATVELTATPAASVGSDVRYAVTVAGAGTTPTGSVELSDGGVPVAACGTNGTVPLAAGTVTCDAGTALAAGMHDIVASYSGDATYAPAAALVAEPVAVASAGGTSGGTSGGSAPGGTGGGAPAGGGAPGAGGGGAVSGGTPGAGTPGMTGGASPGTPSAPGAAGGQGSPPGSSSAAPAPGAGAGPGASGGTGPTGVGGGTSPGRQPRRPTLALSAPHVGLPHRRVVYRARVAGGHGPIGGTVTFSVDGHPVRGCTRVSLGAARALEVTCTLASGFASPGYRVVSVTYSGSRRYGRTTSAVLEEVVPPWSGYWLVSATGRALAYGGAARLAPARVRGPLVGATMSPAARGLWVLSRTGAVGALGATRPYGSAPAGRGPYSAIAATRDGHGYWVLARDGAVVGLGDARHFAPARGSAGTGPFVAIAATPDGLGYWTLTSNGTVVARGDARTYPLRGGRPEAAGPFVAIAPSGDGRGYTLLSAGGVLVAFGDARPVAQLVRPPAGGFTGLLATADHRGFWLVARHGVVVALGDARRLAPTTRPSPATTVAIAGT